MRVEIIAIGSEVLRGATVNTNAAYLGRALSYAGYKVFRHTVLPDEPEMVQQEISKIVEMGDLVVVTGGLGPTCDDLTRNIFAELFGKTLVFSEEVAADLRCRFGEELTSLQNQSMVPCGAKIFCNPLGTAPAIVFMEKGKTVVLLPGVPEEMKMLFREKILPFLIEKSPPKLKVYSEEFHLCLLKENRVDPFLRQLMIDFPEIEVGIYPFYGTLSIRFSCLQKILLDEAIVRFLHIFKSYVFSSFSPKLAEALQETMKERKKTLALAESFTGGAMAAMITSVPGSSAYFLGSFISYANSFKTSQLHVSPSVLERFGAVSREVVAEMLKGLFVETDADYGVAVSGIAGPDGGSRDKPVGTAWIAIGERGQVPHIGLQSLKGNREVIIMQGVQLPLGMLWQHVKHQIIPFGDEL